MLHAVTYYIIEGKNLNVDELNKYMIRNIRHKTRFYDPNGYCVQHSFLNAIRAEPKSVFSLSVLGIGGAVLDPKLLYKAGRNIKLGNNTNHDSI